LIRKFSTAVATGAMFAALSTSAVALAAPGDPCTGAAACQPQQGQIITATAAQSGLLGEIISGIAPINQVNQESLFSKKCSQP